MLPTLNLEAFTGRTVTDVNALRMELDHVRKQYVSFDDEEFSIGVRCIATPIFKHDGTIGAAIGVSGPSPRVTDDRLKEWEALLRDEAYNVSTALGWEPPVTLPSILAGF